VSHTVLSTTTPRARRPYECDLCLWQIDSGERYVRTVHVLGGEIEQRREHIACDALFQKARAEVDIFSDEVPGDFGGVIDWWSDELTPETLAEVRRVWDGEGER
jgi:hypothetical protein